MRKESGQGSSEAFRSVSATECNERKGRSSEEDGEQSRQKAHEIEIRKLLNLLIPTEVIFSRLVPRSNTSWHFWTLVFLALCWSRAKNWIVVDSLKYGSTW